jgi:RNA polymerase sigma-70 factor (ECF subfamily)
MTLNPSDPPPEGKSVDTAHPSPPGETDEVLMRKAMAGDRKAYADLFARHAERIRRTAYLIVHSTSTADDVVQETFTKGLSHLSTYRGESPPQAWFCAISVNECRHFLRDGRRGAELAGSEKLDEGRRIARPRTRGVVTHAVQKEDIRLLTLAMGYLTEAQREVFVLHYQDNLPYEEIGRILDMSPGAARALAHRAKETLREKLGPHAPFGKSK